jgi:predicted ester cyclase
MGTPEDNKALVLRFMDALQRGDIATAANCFDAERYYSHAYEADLAGTWEQQKASFRAKVWSDVESERIALVAEGDRVVHHGSFTGTHTGTFLGIPASGRRVTMQTLESWRIDGDKSVEHWGGLVVTEKIAARIGHPDS